MSVFAPLALALIVLSSPPRPKTGRPVVTTKKKAPAASKPKAKAPTVADAPPKPVAEPPADPWEFDGLIANVTARGETTDSLSSVALEQLGIQLEGAAQLKVSAHSNSLGGVTLKVEDPSDPAVGCALYGKRDGERLLFEDNRCAFPVLTGRLRTIATCRKISGMAKRIKDTVALEARAPDCSAQPLGLPVSIRASAVPRY